MTRAHSTQRNAETYPSRVIHTVAPNMSLTDAWHLEEAAQDADI